jgi:hypothetical protein
MSTVKKHDVPKLGGFTVSGTQPPELLESLARSNLDKLKCSTCGAASLTSQGVSEEVDSV